MLGEAKRFKAEVDILKNELSEHLDSINLNSDEITEVYDHMVALDAKLEKITERLDQLDIMINPCMESLGKDIRLTKREEEVFKTLYTAEEPLTPKKLARLIGSTEPTVVNHLYNLIAKGVPIVKEYVDKTIHVHLNPRFRDIHAKKKLVKIDSRAKDETSLMNYF